MGPKRIDEEEMALRVREAEENWMEITVGDVLAFAPKGRLPSETSLRLLAIDTYIARGDRRRAL